MSQRTFVIGVGMTKFEKPGRREGWDYPDMAREAGTAALDAAGISYDLVEQAAVGYCYGYSTAGQRALYWSVGAIALAIFMAFLGAAGMGIFLFLLFVAFWGYGGLMEAFCNGQTLGKMAVGVRVVSETGLSINAGQAMLRNVLRSADLVPPFFPGVVAMLFGSRFQRLGDLAAGTMVVLDGQRSSLDHDAAGDAV